MLSIMVIMILGLGSPVFEENTLLTNGYGYIYVYISISLSLYIHIYDINKQRI